ncbi:hypothetical protein B0H14DRAFT_2627067 [Mycena olivaceomarginata]|nr:hypothetical protein B0H14DRAFT_2627067 [Mycena olivaceomarginata]
MPHQLRVPQIDLVNITTYLAHAVTLLTELNDAFGPPFVQPIANTIQGLMNIVQLMENIPKILYIIVDLHLKPETVGSLPSAMLDNIGRFLETLHKIHKFFEAQQDGNRIKHLFRNNELQSLLKDCHAGLDQAVETFRVWAMIAETHTIFNSISEMKMKASLMHQELLKLIQTLSDPSISSEGTSVCTQLMSGPPIDPEPVLPNGLSDDPLVQSNFSISNILSCKAALLATALAYQDGNKRLRSLMPIRGYIQQSLPPSPSLIQGLCKHFFSLFELCFEYQGEQLLPVIKQITLNLRDLQEVLQQGLYLNALDLVDTIHSILFLYQFHRITGHGQTMLMQYIQHLLMKLGDFHLEVQFSVQMSRSWQAHPTLDAQHLITQTIPLVEHVNDPILTYIAGQHILDGDYCTAQVYVTQGHRTAHLSATLFQEAKCVQCDFKWSITQLLRARGLLDICGSSGRDLDQRIAITQGAFHLMKSEYAQARGIFTWSMETNLPDQNTVLYLFSLINVALIDIKIGTDAKEVYQKLNQAKDIAKKYHAPSMIAYCSTSQAYLDLRERKFDIAKDEFQKGGRTDSQVVSLCLENLANIRAWPPSDWPARWPVIYCGYAYKTKTDWRFPRHFSFWGIYFAEGQGHTSEAISYGKAGRPLFEQSLQAKDVAHIDAKLLAVEKGQHQALLELENLNVPHLVKKEISGIEEVDERIGEESEENSASVAMK